LSTHGGGVIGDKIGISLSIDDEHDGHGKRPPNIIFKEMDQQQNK
jgi:hypothetical protein